jgi:hypothetical protein
MRSAKCELLEVGRVIGMPTIVMICRRNIIAMSDSDLSPTGAGELQGSTRRAARWTVKEVLEQVMLAGEEAGTLVSALLDWAADHHLGIKGGRGLIDRSVTLYADSGRGKGLLSLYAAENGGGPMLELRIERMCRMPPYDRDEARDQLTADLRALGIGRLDAQNILTAVRPNIPLGQLTTERLERLLALVDRCLA